MPCRTGRNPWASDIRGEKLQSVGNLRWQSDEPVSDLIRLRDLQCLADRQGLSPARFCLRVAAGRPQRIAKIPQRLGLPVAVPQLPEDGAAALVAGYRLLVAPQPLVDDAE